MPIENNKSINQNVIQLYIKFVSCLCVNVLSVKQNIFFEKYEIPIDVNIVFEKTHLPEQM